MALEHEGTRVQARHPVRAVLFDLDGTLIDSEPNNYLADRQLLARYGVDFADAEKRRYVGSSNLVMMQDLVQRFGLRVSPDTLVTEKNALYLEIAEHATRAYPQMVAFLDRVQAAGLPVAVASGSSPGVIRRLLAVVGLADRFPHWVSAEEVAEGKPAPDVFLEAARRLGVAPAECVVVEDSAPGVEAANRAGMRCIAVPYLVETPLAPVFARADLLVPAGMTGFDPDLAWAWLAGLVG